MQKKKREKKTGGEKNTTRNVSFYKDKSNFCISGKERFGLGNERAARIEKINVNTLLTKRLKAQN